MTACTCERPHGQKWLPVDEAIARLLAQAPAPPPSEWVALDAASGRIVAEPQFARLDSPAWDNSAMDGYALRSADLPAAGGWLPLAGRIAAGEAAAALTAGHAVRIFTGAPLPALADTVVAQEDVQLHAAGVQLPPVKPGQHVRKRAEESSAGALLLSAGRRLRAQDLGLLASQGIDQLPVYRPLRVALLSSGDELREPGQPLAPGQIYNANQQTLANLLQGWGCQLSEMRVMPDSLSQTCEQLLAAAANADVLISSGGVSVGEEDHLKAAVQQLGRLDLWQLAIQPGKPLAFGAVAGTPWIGLPGNPVAVWITALIIARPWLLKAQGRDEPASTGWLMPAAFDWPKAKPRRQFLRARLQTGATGQQVILHPQQGSAMLAAASWADGLADIGANATLGHGDPVRYWPLSELLY
ncbi:MAG: molybdopterin molybdenumtransferase MoeA [Gammaproteobacteria bacterium HGW-Gammaproteobacteria-11]|nr:MAG: molybdopterin molybdenumtransferase MoeA [Gammaproteobacteria bacterium HGW-Gammaproteobacteria-11]